VELIIFKMLCLAGLILISATNLANGADWAKPIRNKDEGLTVRVDNSKGVPRLLVNGQPRRARVLWCGPSSNSIILTPGGRNIAFEFEPGASVDNGTMQFRFGNSPGTIQLDNIRITDMNTDKDVVPVCDFESGPAVLPQDWDVFPAADQNSVGKVRVEDGAGVDGSRGLSITLEAPADGNWPDFHIYHQPNLTFTKGHKYRVSFWGKADVVRDIAVVFLSGDSQTLLGGPPTHQESQIKLAAGAGVDLVSYEVNLPWPAPGEPENWTAVDEATEYILRANPKALLLVRINSYTPQWWKEKYPDDLMKYDDGKDHPMGYYGNLESVTSVHYQEGVAEQLRLLIEHMESKYNDHMAGYHPSGQNAAEWFYFECWAGLMNGYAKCDLIAWRAWLKKTYGNVESLRTAWDDPTASFDTAAVPSGPSRRAAPYGTFRDPIKERPILDFIHFQQETMADIVCKLAEVTRKATKGRKLVLFFFGYVYEWGSMATGPGASGHFGLRRALSNPNIDMLCGPISYSDRGVGGNALCMSAAESIALAGKMWLNEDDTRTYLAKNPDFPGGRTFEESLGVLTRNTSQEAFRNLATWWMDLPRQGWFDDPGFWKRMSELQRLDDVLLKNPIPYKPQIALVLDEEGMMCLSAGQTVGDPYIYTGRTTVGRVGAPYGQYLQDDVIAGRVHSKLYIFSSAWKLTSETRAKLLTATKDSTKVWCYAPGYFDGNNKSLEAMHELTGFNLQPVTPGNALATPTELGKKMGLTQPIGINSPITPLFAATDAKPEEILATYPDGSAAIAMRKGTSGNSIFTGVPGLTTEFVRLAAKSARVHLYTDTDCNVYENGPYLSLHASKNGPITLNTGRTAVVMDILTGEKLGKGPTITLNMKLGQTRVLKLGVK